MIDYNKNLDIDLHSILLADDVVTSIIDNLDYLVDIIPEIQFMFGFFINILIII